MSASVDPFDRAVERERKLRERGAIFYSQRKQMRFIIRIFAALAVGWAALLTVHWLVLSDPRWLVVLHTMIFAITVGMWIAASAFVTWMQRRRSELLDDAEHTP
jgi:fatty acid desaturase